MTYELGKTWTLLDGLLDDDDDDDDDDCYYLRKRPQTKMLLVYV